MFGKSLYNVVNLSLFDVKLDKEKVDFLKLKPFFISWVSVVSRPVNFSWSKMSLFKPFCCLACVLFSPHLLCLGFRVTQSKDLEIPKIEKTQPEIYWRLNLFPLVKNVKMISLVSIRVSVYLVSFKPIFTSLWVRKYIIYLIYCIVHVDIVDEIKTSSGSEIIWQVLFQL